MESGKIVTQNMRGKTILVANDICKKPVALGKEFAMLQIALGCYGLYFRKHDKKKVFSGSLGSSVS